jgi:hypothetical protein
MRQLEPLTFYVKACSPCSYISNQSTYGAHTLLSVKSRCTSTARSIITVLVKSSVITSKNGVFVVPRRWHYGIKISIRHDWIVHNLDLCRIKDAIVRYVRSAFRYLNSSRLALWYKLALLVLPCTPSLWDTAYSLLLRSKINLNGIALL